MIRQLIQGDNLSTMRSIGDNTVDLVYLDPPFNTGKDFGAYNDKWEGRKAYLSFIGERVRDCQRLLKDTGSLYLHCDYRESAYLKILLDEIFGEQNFINEIIWCYSNAGRAG